jgi:hypothetical protein
MINRFDSKDGKRSMIGVFPDEDLSVTVDENNVSIIEGSMEALRVLYDCLQDLFGDEEGCEE